MKYVPFFLSSFFLCAPVLAYKAVVYDYSPSTELTPQATILKNIDNYRAFVEEVNNQSVNIFVFPEYGLTGLVEDPAPYAVEINVGGEVIKKLKDIALEHNVYLVVNLLEKASNKYYNTILVFNGLGNIEHTYRKINLYKEPKLTPGASNQKLTFKAAFGPTFGVFTGRDILFVNPSRRVLEDEAVRDIIYPTLWHSVMPFLTSLSVQRGYADANGVNLLAAGYSKPTEGHGGSGIYLGDGTIKENYIADTASNKSIIQAVLELPKRVDKTACPLTGYGPPDNHATSTIINYKTTKLFTTAGAVFIPIDLRSILFSHNLCLNDLCCSFDLYKDSTNPREFYKGMFFNGEVDLGDGPTHYQICSVLACSSDASESCGDRIESVTSKFKRISVQAKGLKQTDKLTVPVTVSSYLLPIENTQYCQNGNTSVLATLKGAENVLVFGIVRREVLLSGAAALRAYGLFILITFTVVKFFVL